MLRCKKIVSAILVLTMMVCFGTTVFATSDSDTSLSAMNDGITLIADNDVVSASEVQVIDHIERIEEDSFINKQRAMFEFAGEYLNNPDTLTASDPEDFYFFSTQVDKFFMFAVSSKNSNVYAQLCQVDWSTGTIYPTNVISSANAISQMSTALPAGDYALRILSRSAVTSNISYSAMTNFSVNYKPNIQLINVSNILQYVQYQIGDNVFIISSILR